MIKSDNWLLSIVKHRSQVWCEASSCSCVLVIPATGLQHAGVWSCSLQPGRANTTQVVAVGRTEEPPGDLHTGGDGVPNNNRVKAAT